MAAEIKINLNKQGFDLSWIIAAKDEFKQIKINYVATVGFDKKLKAKHNEYGMLNNLTKNIYMVCHILSRAIKINLADVVTRVSCLNVDELKTEIVH